MLLSSARKAVAVAPQKGLSAPSPHRFALNALGFRGRVADCENENRDAQNEIQRAENHDRKATGEIAIDAPEDEAKGARRKHLLGHGFGQTLAPAFQELRH